MSNGNLSKFVFVLIITLSAASFAQETPRNIILFIGDGMGTAQLSALQLRHARTNFDRLPVAGFSLTQSATHFVTESSAGGTALSTGARTFNGAIAVDSAGRHLPTVLECAHARGRATGVVVTSSITHATPAAFLAHVNLRKKEFEIAEQIVTSGADVLIGGGMQFFREHADGGSGGATLLDAMRDSGYAVMTSFVCDMAGTGRILMLLADEGLPAAEQRPYSLGDLTACALSRVNTNPKGFFLMVEGSQIDWACHNHELDQMTKEMEDFDGAVGRGLDFAETHPGTLVIVTADHETGGLALNGRKTDGSDMKAAWSYDDHSAAMVPVFAFGPCAALFGGIHENREIGRRIMQLITNMEQ